MASDDMLLLPARWAPAVATRQPGQQTRRQARAGVLICRWPKDAECRRFGPGCFVSAAAQIWEHGAGSALARVRLLPSLRARDFSLLGAYDHEREARWSCASVSPGAARMRRPVWANLVWAGYVVTAGTCQVSLTA
jgi:hypothetical protein